MIDTHCHLTTRQFAGRVADILSEARAAGVSGFISIATTTSDAEAALAVASEHSDVWCSSGVHPLYADESASTARDWAQLRAVAEHERCVAWGELGLDRHYDTPLLETQQVLLEEQLAAIESCQNDGLDLPVVIHCREAFEELLPILGASSLPNDRFVFHCFTGTPDDARSVLDFGAWISFTGIVTFRNASDIAASFDLVPSDRLMVETDAPYLSPEPVRKIFPNVPAHVMHTGRFLADRRGMDFPSFASMVDANAVQFFGLPTG